MYKGSYSIELHARTNAIGMPINTSNFFQNGFIQNNNDMSNIFYSTYWERIIGLTGTIKMNNTSVKLIGKRV